MDEWFTTPKERAEWRSKYVFGEKNEHVDWVRMLDDLAQLYPSLLLTAPGLFQEMTHPMDTLGTTWEPHVADVINWTLENLQNKPKR